MEHGDAALGAKRAELVLELTGLVHCFIDECLGDRFAERRQLAAPVAAHEALDPGKADALDLHRLLVEHRHARPVEDFADLLRAAAFVIVVAEDAEYRNRARPDIL